MEKSKKIFAAKCAAVLSAIPIAIYGFASGPDPRKTGAPGDSICSEAGCHVGTPNSGGGRVEITFPGGLTYTPGARQRLTVTVTDSAARVYGFQASARPQSNESNGQAGRFEPADSSTFVLCQEGSPRPSGGNCRDTAPLEFIEHNQPRTTNTFSFDWTPPATDVGPVRFFVAANAANGNGQNTGDRIYTANFTLTPTASSSKPAFRQENPVVVASTTSPTITSGAWLEIFGSNLAPTTRTWRDNEIVDGKLPTELDGVRVTIDNKPAFVFFISPAQVNVLSPGGLGAGPVQVRVTTRDGGESDAITVMAQSLSPAFLRFSPENGRYPAAVHIDGTFLGKTDLFQGAVVTRPARPGDRILLFGTGFGATDPAVTPGEVTRGAPVLTTPARILIGDQQATIEFQGLAPNLASLYQFNVVVPDVPNGDQTVVAEVGSVRTQTNLFITVQR